MNQLELDALWFSFQPIPGVAFGLNDAVRIKSSEHRGALASVVSLVEIDPVPVYIVELGSNGTDVRVVESDLEPAV